MYSANYKLPRLTESVGQETTNYKLCKALQKLFCCIFLIFNFSFLIFAQTDSCHVRISLLTCTPGEELYSTFGHSALRVTDSIANRDIVYNYGTFNFEEPGFYTKFIRGKLLYYLSTDDFFSFQQSYKQENRGITEQVLNLNCNEKSRIVQLLRINLQPQNRGYKYDFLFDNCTTRLRDIVEKAADSSVYFGKVVNKKTRFRQLIYQYLDRNNQQWSKLGIDLFLGSKTDAIMTNREVMFLPDYLMKTFDSSRIGDKVLVSSTQNLFEISLQKKNENFITHPLFIFSLLFVIIVLLSFSKKISIQKFLYRFDGLVFFITGFVGLMILFMWFGTDHVMTKNNYNLLWAIPTHVVAAFYMHSNKAWMKKYFLMTAILNSVLLIAWNFLPQHFNTSLLPIVLLLIFRSAWHSVRSNIQQ